MKIIRLYVFLLFCLYSVSSFSCGGFAGDIDGRVYVNPAVQIGYTFNKGWFHGYQISANKVMSCSLDIIGFTGGLRRYSNESNYYVDIQVSNSGVIGIGLGESFQISDDGSLKNVSYRIKGWYGFFVLGTFDFMIPKENFNEYKFSLGGVLSAPITVFK